MKENKLLTLSQEFAVEIIKISQSLKDKKEYGFADQIKRAGTSISANIAEGNNPQSRANMISKFEIALKEASETEKRLEIFYKNFKDMWFRENKPHGWEVQDIRIL